MEIPIVVQGHQTTAVVDTAAMVTLVNKKVFPGNNSFSITPQEISLKGLGQQKITGQLFKNVECQIGLHSYTLDMCVVDMKDSVILGLDFLEAHKCIVDLRRNLVEIGNDKITASLKHMTKESVTISRVTIQSKSIIPANSVGFVSCSLKTPIDTKYIVEPLESSNFLCSSVLGQGDTVKLKVVNDSNKSVKFKVGQHVGNAESVEIQLNQLDSDIAINKVSVENNAPSNQTLPNHLQELYDRSSEGLNQDESQMLFQLLSDFSDIFSTGEMDLGCLKGVKHHINTGNATPVKQKFRRTPLGFQDQEKEHLQKLLDTGVITPSSSEWASAPVLVKKKDGSVRYCIDFRDLNSRTVKDCYPLPLIADCMDVLYGTTFFSTLDLAMGYYQIEIDENSRNKTAFLTKYGLFEHQRMAFGLCNAPATFQRAMGLVLRGMDWEELLVYLDDIIVLGKTFSESLENLRKAFQRFREYNLKLKPKKCCLFRREVEFLGRIINSEGVHISPDKIETIKNWPIPQDKKQVQAFLGFANYHRDHIKGFANIAIPLYDLLQKKTKFVWAQEQQCAFDCLKQTLINPECLKFPSPDGTFLLDTDASNHSIGAVLYQINNGKEEVISYASHALLKEQRKYCTTRKELLAVVKFCRHFRHYLLGKPFLIRTDHHSLTWLMRFRHIEGQLARWLEELSSYDFQIKHRSGSSHVNADALSRIPDTLSECACYDAGNSPKNLPCLGCHYCTRAHHQWSRFQLDVDDVIPLSIKSEHNKTLKLLELL